MTLEQNKYNNILKIDLDVKSYTTVKKILSERLNFLDNYKIMPLHIISSIELIKKVNYSVKIYLNNHTENINLLILQAILGDDWKRTGIMYRDLMIENKEHWNKMFDVKRYPDGTYLTATKKDITLDILEEINKIKKINNS